MSKRSVKDGKVLKSYRTQFLYRITVDSIDAERLAKENKGKKNYQKGARGLAIDGYKKAGRMQDAIDAVAVVYKDLYSDKIIEGWIRDELSKNNIFTGNSERDKDDDGSR